MSPSIYAALVDSLFQNPAPMFAGRVFAAVAAVMTALKTGDNLLWPCVALLIVTGAVARLRHAALSSAQFDAHRRRRRGLGDALSDRGDVLCRRAGFLVPGHAARQRRCRRAHDLRDRHHRYTWRPARAGPTAGRGYSICRSCSPAVRCRSRWRCMAGPITSAMAVLCALFLHRRSSRSPPACSGSSCRRWWRASARRRWRASSTPR